MQFFFWGLPYSENILYVTSEYYREVNWAPEIPNVKEFFKNIHSILTGLSFKVTNQVASFTQSANDSQAELFIECLLLLADFLKLANWLVNLKLKGGIHSLGNRDNFWKFFHIWNIWGPMHLSIIFWCWSWKNSESWYSLVPNQLFWLTIVFCSCCSRPNWMEQKLPMPTCLIWEIPSKNQEPEQILLVELFTESVLSAALSCHFIGNNKISILF